MTISEILNSLGILIIIVGALLGARGFFSEKDTDLVARTQLMFGNDEHFKSMIFQKYNEIAGFFLIIFGSIVQLSTVIFNLDSKYHYNVKIIVPLLIILTILSIITLIKLVNYITEYRIDYVDVKLWSDHYLKTSTKVELTDYEQKQFLKAEEKINEILLKRCKNFKPTSIEETIQTGRKKFKIK
ncbi:hypothetical protein [Wenyingzhuangia sp. IMCC45467]